MTSYDDLLANDVELFVGYRRELMKHGIFELPLNLKRSHFSYAHTDDDVDRLLEATEAAVTTVLGRAMSHLADRVHDRPGRAGRQVGRLRDPEVDEHGRLGARVHPDRARRERRRADGARARRQPRRRVRGPGRRRSSCCASCSPEQVSGRVIVIPCLSPEASRAGTRLWPSGANFNRSFPGALDGPPNEQLAALRHDACSSRSPTT